MLRTISQSVCLSIRPPARPPTRAFQFQNFWTDFNEIWYESYTAGDHLELYLLILYNWPELARWERQFRHYRACAVFAFQRVRLMSHFAQVEMEYTCAQLCTYVHICKAVQLEFKLQHAGTGWAAAWPPRHVCYRPAVFSRHFHLTALSFSQEKNSAPLRNVIVQFFAFWKCFKSEIA